MNDPVGIALMIGMVELATEDDGDFSIVVTEFAKEMAVGLAVGIFGALLLLPVMRNVRLTGPALYPIRVLAGAGIIYGLAAVAGGSGFLAAFVAGIVLGDAVAPRKGEIEGFLSSLAAWRRSPRSSHWGSRPRSETWETATRGPTGSRSRRFWPSSRGRWASCPSSYRRA